MEHKVTSTGYVDEIHSFKDRIPEFDPRTGDHLWVVVNTYKCDPTKFASGEQFIMDRENLLSVSGPGCLYCVREYTPQLASRRCKGRE